MVHPPIAQQENETAAQNAPASRVDHVRSYFGQSRNYLDIRRYVIETRKEIVQEFLAGRTPNSILDIGCGDGSLTVPLLTPNTRLTLLDISPAMLAKAISQTPPQFVPNVRTLNDDFMKVPVEPSSFDLVVCVGVLAHVESPAAVIEKAASVLRPGGLLILECTDAAHFTNRLTVLMGHLWGLFSSKRRGYSSNLVSASSVCAMAQRQGLTLTSSFRHNLALPLMRRVFDQESLHRQLRLIFGSAGHNRNAWLGKECLFLFSKS